MTDDNRPETLESATEVIPPPSDTDGSRSSTDERLSELTRERDEYEDLLLRKTADFDNFQKRVERERKSVNESAAVDLITELLPLIDDLERALMSEANAGSATCSIYADCVCHSGFPRGTVERPSQTRPPSAHRGSAVSGDERTQQFVYDSHRDR